MSELIVDGKNVIEPADFEQNKNEIAVLRNQVPSNIALGSFTENFLFFDANVKAKDMNSVMATVQNAFIEVFQCNKNLFDEIGILYQALGSLDEGYLKGIISAIQAAQEANEKAANAISAINATLRVLEGFKKRLDKIKHLNDVDDTWEKAKKLDSRCRQLEKQLREQLRQANSTLQGLTTFKKNVEKQKHLEDIDRMFSDLGLLLAEVKAYKQQNDKAIRDVSQTVSEMVDYITELKRYEHLADIDTIWTDVENLKLKTQDLTSTYEEGITNFQNSIEERMKAEKQLSDRLQIAEDFDKKLSEYEHLSSIDEMWTDVQSAKNNIDANASALALLNQKYYDFQTGMTLMGEYIDNLKSMSHLPQIDQEWEHSQDMEKRLSSVEDNLPKVQAEYLEIAEELKRKLLTAYYISGGTLAVLVLYIILNVVGVF